MKFYISDLYQSEIHYPLDEVTNDVLYYLYQPIIGKDTISTYMFLYTEGKRNLKEQSYSSLSRLLDYQSMNLEELEECILKLEGIGLLKTYVKHDDLTQYIFALLSPLSLTRFFKNQILCSLLKESLSDEDFKKTLNYFKYNYQDKKDFEEITSSFNDIYEITNKPIRLSVKHLKERESEEIHYFFDESLLKQKLREYQISSRLLTKEDLTNISDLVHVYSIDTLTVASLVKDAIEDKKFSLKKFKLLIQDYYDVDSSKLTSVFYKQPVSHLSYGNDPLSLHMQYLDSITPYELLKDKQGGKEPVYHDLKIIETLMNQLSLNPSVVNVLIEYVLSKQNGRLSSRYCEAIGSTLARKKVETSMDAYKVLTENDDNNKEGEEETPSLSNDLSQEEMDDLLKELKEYSHE